MKANHLSIMTLEEHEANTEFVGRNFNAGEIIQLVLKSYRTGQWLSFKTVQLVMMHELAHCNQMNHSRAFWKMRNQYAEELRVLWQQKYSGDGLWGRGQTLLSGQYDTGRRAEEDVLPEHLCGGAYRSARRRKRWRAGASDAKKNETYAEKKQKRIAKKFGVVGQALGGDNEVRVKLEKGQELKAQPRVANSSRGRELRVAAALARFGRQKEENFSEQEATKADDVKHPEESFSSIEDESEGDLEAEESSNAGTTSVIDRQGHRMVQVCGSEDQGDIHVKEELDELRDLDISIQETKISAVLDEDAETTDEDDPAEHSASVGQESINVDSPEPLLGPSSAEDTISCPVCSMVNAQDSALCLACSNVLNGSKVPDRWKCHSEVCRGSEYVNAGDCGLCGVCGSRKPDSSSTLQ